MLFRSHLLREGKPVLPTERWKLIREFVLQRCDALDGKQDGRIDAPRECKLDFAALTKTPDGLTEEQAATLQSLYGGVQDAAGRIVYPVLEPGSEFFAEVWLSTSGDRPGWGILASDGYRRLLSASVDEPATGVGAPVAAMQSLIARSKVPALTDATNPDLRPLARSGGKLLIYHGLADPLIIPKPMEDYYDRAARQSGLCHVAGRQQIQVPALGLRPLGLLHRPRRRLLRRPVRRRRPHRLLDRDASLSSFDDRGGRHGNDLGTAARRRRDRKSTRLNSSHIPLSRMPSSA